MICEDYTQADLNEKDRAILDFAAKITEGAFRVTPKDHERLKQVGFSEKGIFQIAALASWFNYINRMADSLGVGREI